MHPIRCITLLSLCLSTLMAASVPTGFVDEEVFASVDGAFALGFAPDGRMFFTEWRKGWIRVATYDAASDRWTLRPQPFHAFDTPDAPGNGGIYNSSGVATGSEAARRGTLRGFAFDPDFASNGRIYVSYMHDSERSGYRISRVQASAGDPDRSTGGETVLFKAQPFHGDRSQPDAHNGGGLCFGGDGKLYASFGDGWKEASAQNRSTFAGKVIRLNKDGSIPSSNPFYDSFSGDARAIYALGLRNPVCLSTHPSGAVYANSYQGSSKADMYRILAGANYGHGGSGGGGTPTGVWLNTRIGTGGSTWTAWYPNSGDWPAQYRGTGYVSNWNGAGEIVRLTGSEGSPGKTAFATGVKFGSHAVVALAVGPDGSLYYTAREYGETTRLRRIRYVAPTPTTPSVTVHLDHSVVEEGDGTTLRVRRSTSAGSLSVTIDARGSASAGDVNGIPNTVGFSDGQSERSFALSAVDDATTEPDEIRTISVASDGGYTVGDPGSVDLLIPENDIPLRDPDRPGTVDPGLAFTYRHLVAPTTVGDIADGAIAADGTRAGPTVARPDDRGSDYGFTFVGFFTAVGDGVYTFATTSDDGSTVHIGDTLVVANDGVHGDRSRSGTVGLKAGLHAITIRYFQGTGGASFALRYRDPTMDADATVPSYLWFRSPVVDSGYGREIRGSITARLGGAFPATAGGTLPATLSATGAFTDLASLTPRSGLIPYDVNAPLWSDHALKVRWIAVPNGETVGFAPTGSWDFPTGTVLVKHFELGTDERDPDERTRLETRFLVKGGSASWYGVTYRWRADGSEADLLGADGGTRDLTIRETDGGSRSQRWTFPARADCLSCHNPSAGFALGANTRQLNGDFTYPSSSARDNQLRTLNHIGLFDRDLDESAIPGYAALAALDDTGASLERRVRSYLDANCAQCHHPDGPGHGGLDARFDTPLASQGLIDGAVTDSLGIDGARVLKPRDQWRSVLLHRIDVRGDAIQMPPLGSAVIDAAAVAAIRSYLGGLDGDPALAPPTIDPAGGSFDGSVTVQATHPDAAATLRYRLDGAVPAASDPAWPTGGLVLDANAQLRVNAWRSGHATSISAAAAFSITPLPGTPPVARPTATPMTGQAPLVVAFDGSASGDDDAVASWSWAFGDGATASGATANHTYTAAGSYTATLTVTDGAGHSDSAEVTITVEPPPPDPVELLINFQPATAPGVAGYLVDAGDPFGDHGGDRPFGWSEARRELRDRNEVIDQLLDTLLYPQRGGAASWEVALPPGRYRVRLVCGDPSYRDHRNHFELEGVGLRDLDGDDHYDEYEVDLRVDDGRLTLRPAADAKDATLCLIEIISLGADG